MNTSMGRKGIAKNRDDEKMRDGITETDVVWTSLLVTDNIRVAVMFWLKFRDYYDALEAAMLEVSDAYLEAWR